MHGNGVVQSPAFPMKTSPDGVWSLTVTPEASDGPPLPITIRNEMVSPRFTPPGPVFVIERSAETPGVGVAVGVAVRVGVLVAVGVGVDVTAGVGLAIGVLVGVRV